VAEEQGNDPLQLLQSYASLSPALAVPLVVGYEVLHVDFQLRVLYHRLFLDFLLLRETDYGEGGVDAEHNSSVHIHICLTAGLLMHALGSSFFMLGARKCGKLLLSS
jgi:hypothetical protein